MSSVVVVSCVVVVLCCRAVLKAVEVGELQATEVGKVRLV